MGIFGKVLGIVGVFVVGFYELIEMLIQFVCIYVYIIVMFVVVVVVILVSLDKVCWEL